MSWILIEFIDWIRFNNKDESAKMNGVKNIFIPILANITFFGEAKQAYNNISGDNTEMAESYTLLSLFFHI